jgi:predicted CoA-binding protein
MIPDRRVATLPALKRAQRDVDTVDVSGPGGHVTDVVDDAYRIDRPEDTNARRRQPVTGQLRAARRREPL